MIDKEDRAIMARVNPEFNSHMKKRVIFEYPRFRGEARYDKNALFAEIKKVKQQISDAVFNGEPTEDLLVKREVLYLLAEDLGLM